MASCLRTCLLRCAARSGASAGSLGRQRRARDTRGTRPYSAGACTLGRQRRACRRFRRRSNVNAFALGAQVAAARLRSRTLGVLTVFGLLTVAIVALLERRTGSVLSTDRALAGVALGLCRPALAYGVVRTATGGQRLANSLWPIARYGQSRRRIALGVLSAATLANAGIGLVLAVLCVLCVRLPADPLLMPDALTSAWIGPSSAAA